MATCIRRKHPETRFQKMYDVIMLPCYDTGHLPKPAGCPVSDKRITQPYSEGFSATHSIGMKLAKCNKAIPCILFINCNCDASFLILSQTFVVVITVHRGCFKKQLMKNHLKIISKKYEEIKKLVYFKDYYESRIAYV